MTLILDSGGLLAALDPDQNRHREFREALEETREPRIISPFVVAELDYMISRDYGRDGQLAFHEEDFSRARSLIETCKYLPGFGIADASNVVLAERYEAFDIPPPTREISARSSARRGIASVSCLTIPDRSGKEQDPCRIKSS